MDLSRRQKIYTDTAELNTTINQLDIMEIHRQLHPTTAEHTFFSSSHGTATKIDHIQDHKRHLNKFKRTEITKCLL
jgi:hypothetical protein